MAAHIDTLTFGAMLIEHRAAHGLTQRDLADLTGVNQAAISLWERDKQWPGRRDLSKLVRILGIDRATLSTAIARTIETRDVS